MTIFMPPLMRTYTEDEVRLVMLGMQTDIDALVSCLQDCLEDSQAQLAAHLEAYGETYRPQRAAALRKQIAEAQALIEKHKAKT